MDMQELLTILRHATDEEKRELFRILAAVKREQETHVSFGPPVFCGKQYGELDDCA